MQSNPISRILVAEVELGISSYALGPTSFVPGLWILKKPVCPIPDTAPRMMPFDHPPKTCLDEGVVRKRGEREGIVHAAPLAYDPDPGPNLLI